MSKRFRDRWDSDDGRLKVAEVLRRFASSEPLDDLELGVTEGGRLDLRGFTLPPVSAIGEVRAAGVVLTETVGAVQLSSVRLTGIDFSHAVLDSLMLTDSVIEDCVFDGAQWREGRLFSSAVDRCSFRSAKLSRLGIGPAVSPSQSAFRDVIFEKSDLRWFAPWGLFERCHFDHARIDDVNLEGTVFRDCKFTGRLEEVIFAARPLSDPSFEPNEMEGCDFGEAELIHVLFRDLAMLNVVWPQTPSESLFDNYPCVVQKAIAALNADPRREAGGIAAALETHSQWMHPARRQGVVHREELAPMTDEVLQWMRRFEAECSQSSTR